MIVKPDYCPTWFDITLYDSLENYSRDDLSLTLWVRQMNYRHVLKELQTADHEEREHYKNYALQWVEHSATNWLKSPLKHKDSQKKENYNPLEADPDIITPVTLSDIGRLYVDFYLDMPEMRKLFQEVKPNLDDFIKNNIDFRDYSSITDMLPENQYSEDEIHSFNQFLQTPCDKNIFWIDFYQSDEILKMAFEQKLQEFREKERQKRTKRFSDAELKKIIEYRILAYIDLYIFGKITDRKFTDVEMAAMIYPPTNNTPLNFDAVDRIARTVRPKAIELLEKTNPRLLL